MIYVRRLTAGDLENQQKKTDPSSVFDLGSSGGSDVSREKDTMIAESTGARSLEVE
jgi:hypothetical protein